METNMTPIYMIGLMAGMLLLATFLRMTVKPLKKMLFSAGIIAGILGFILMGINASANFLPVTNADFEQLSLHILCMNFMAITYLNIGLDKKQSRAERSKRGGFSISLIYGCIMAVQAVIGGVVGLIMQKTVSPNFDLLSGSIIANGFAGSPAAALAAANLWKNYANSDIISIGLSYGAFGFIVASLVGVPMVRHFVNKKMTVFNDINTEQNAAFIAGHYGDGELPVYAKEHIHRSTIDPLLFQIGFLVFTYSLVYIGVNTFISRFVAGATVASTLRSIMFIFCVFGAAIIKSIVNALKLDRFFDRGIQAGIVNFLTDSLLVSCMMAISISVIIKYIVPMGLNIILISAFTVVFSWLLAKRTGYAHVERFLYIFGTATGTAASGQTLLKIVDPSFRTIGDEIVWSNVFAILVCLTTNLAAFVPLTGQYVYLIINLIWAVLTFLFALLLSRNMRKKPSVFAGVDEKK